MEHLPMITVIYKKLSGLLFLSEIYRKLFHVSQGC